MGELRRLEIDVNLRITQGFMQTYKCKDCFIEFETQVQLSSHKSLFHQVTPCQIGYRCSGCAILFPQLDLFLQHQGCIDRNKRRLGIEDNCVCLLCGSAQLRHHLANHYASEHDWQVKLIELGADARKTVPCHMCAPASRGYLKTDLLVHASSWHATHVIIEPIESQKEEQCHLCFEWFEGQKFRDHVVNAHVPVTKEKQVSNKKHKLEIEGRNKSGKPKRKLDEETEESQKQVPKKKRRRRRKRVNMMPKKVQSAAIVAKARKSFVSKTKTIMKMNVVDTWSEKASDTTSERSETPDKPEESSTIIGGSGHHNLTCNKCSKTFEDRDQFALHLVMRVCERTRFSLCPFCGERSMNWQIWDHVTSQHNDIKQLGISVRQSTLSLIVTGLNRHKKDNLDFPCHFCPLKFSKHGLQRLHMTLMHDDDSGERATSSGSVAGDGDVQSQPQFSSSTAQNNRDSIVADDTPIFDCPHCSTVFPTKRGLSTHYVTCIRKKWRPGLQKTKPPKRLQSQQQSSSTVQNDDDSITDAKPVFDCPRCSVILPTKHGLSIHYTKCHQKTSNPSLKKANPMNSVEQKLNRKIMYHGKSLLDACSKEAVSNNRFWCDICNFNFHSNFALETHCKLVHSVSEMTKQSLQALLILSENCSNLTPENVRRTSYYESCPKSLWDDERKNLSDEHRPIDYVKFTDSTKRTKSSQSGSFVTRKQSSGIQVSASESKRKKIIHTQGSSARNSLGVSSMSSGHDQMVHTSPMLSHSVEINEIEEAMVNQFVPKEVHQTEQSQAPRSFSPKVCKSEQAMVTPVSSEDRICSKEGPFSPNVAPTRQLRMQTNHVSEFTSRSATSVSPQVGTTKEVVRTESQLISVDGQLYHYSKPKDHVSYAIRRTPSSSYVAGSPGHVVIRGSGRTVPTSPGRTMQFSSNVYKIPGHPTLIRVPTTRYLTPSTSTSSSVTSVRALPPSSYRTSVRAAAPGSTSANGFSRITPTPLTPQRSLPKSSAPPGTRVIHIGSCTYYGAGSSYQVKSVDGRKVLVQNKAHSQHRPLTTFPAANKSHLPPANRNQLPFQLDQCADSMTYSDASDEAFTSQSREEEDRRNESNAMEQGILACDMIEED